MLLIMKYYNLREIINKVVLEKLREYGSKAFL
jgi:hypothetical protein